MNDYEREHFEELPIVAALRSLSVFSADQGGAYREHSSRFAGVLGADADTKLARYVTEWGREGTLGIIVLTGNAGTGKTAVAEAFCKAVGGTLPQDDGPVQVANARWVVKDLSGLSNAETRTAVVRKMLHEAEEGQALLCANEGVLRDAFDLLDDHDLARTLDVTLRTGAARLGPVTLVNVNRQRPTADGLWSSLLDYVTRAELWTGCTGCPFDSGGCPMRSNAQKLRQPDVREQLRTLVRLGTGEAVPNLREMLAILSWALVGNMTCQEVKGKVRDLGRTAFTASDGYFARVLGGGLTAEAVERSPLLAGMRRAALGDVSDLEVDGWLRDTTGAPQAVRALAGDPQLLPPEREEAAPLSGRRPALAGSRSPLDRVRTKQGPMTFQALGEMVSTDEDPTRVEDGLDALVIGDRTTNPAGQALWRQRLYFEGSAELGGGETAARRLLDYRHLSELVSLARAAAAGDDMVLALAELVRGLNFLVTGFSSPNEGLVVPDPACLFARDPGSFRPARPSLVHSQVGLERLTLAVPDRGLVEGLLDVDHVELDLVVDGDQRQSLRIRPRMYEAIREAGEFQGPVGQGVAEMNDLRSFYGGLADGPRRSIELRVADPASSPPSLVKIILPHFTASGNA